jgi:hypothetical protein
MSRGALLTALCVVATAALLVSAAAGAAPIPTHGASAVDCGDAAGQAVTHASDTRLGPLHVAPAASRQSHWNPRTRRFSAKYPVVIVGSVPVTVAVPARLARRVALGYAHSGLSDEITFSPCPGRRATFFPGGLLFTRLEPISLLVREEGWPRSRVLRLGKFRPRGRR